MYGNLFRLPVELFFHAVLAALVQHGGSFAEVFRACVYRREHRLRVARRRVVSVQVALLLLVGNEIQK